MARLIPANGLYIQVVMEKDMVGRSSKGFVLEWNAKLV